MNLNFPKFAIKLKVTSHFKKMLSRLMSRNFKQRVIEWWRSQFVSPKLLRGHPYKSGTNFLVWLYYFETSFSSSNLNQIKQMKVHLERKLGYFFVFESFMQKCSRMMFSFEFYWNFCMSSTFFCMKCRNFLVNKKFRKICSQKKLHLLNLMLLERSFDDSN